MAEQGGRLAVSYFDHQFDPMALMDPRSFYEARGQQDMLEVAELGFDQVVMCVTELDLASKQRLSLLKNLVEVASGAGLEVNADPWRIGGVFGGEGVSFYEQNGLAPCTHEPKLSDLTKQWLDAVAEAGIERVFWDEPGVGCDEHGNLSLDFIDGCSQEAKSRGITWNSSCVRSRDQDTSAADDIASMVAIDEIGVAPYPFHPKNPVQKSAEEVVEHIRPWFEAIHESADRHNKQAHAWLQGFNISEANDPVLDIYIETIRACGIGNIAVWGFRSCASVAFLNPDTAQHPDTTWQSVQRSLGLSQPAR
ncbi:MAG: hypothetical protein M3Q36_00785 [bacterium]|nr:hypothetical protein [bacterium]